ncbi:hypothetical protein CAPTEDRAFT_226756 [Capitella teleta]|uniref:LNR domain-containing protein n=1 Tax=Capitella teleta TaxID=283909 RepID=N1PBD1_CAPTE|nr:hypothetical protein CAPTEDRAFT_226756 [Capitella teleta]|eukprot:ELU18844.1 hypothetical protein CAPTEDRAFT_226756 [Capitella teleta]
MSNFPTPQQCIDTSLFHLPDAGDFCRIATIENLSLDLACGHLDSDVGPGGSCQLKSIRWQRSQGLKVHNISDAGNYGIRETLPPSGATRGEHVGLLRVRSLQVEDLGMYHCQIQCVQETGVKRSVSKAAQVCMQHSHADYAICGLHLSDHRCERSFWNGYCDADCDVATSFFDGYDCTYDARECEHETSCRKSYADGVCDPECDHVGCAWDGGDCIARPLDFADDDAIVLTLPRWYQHKAKVIDLRYVGRAVSKLLRTITRVLPEEWAADLAYRTGRSREPSWHRPHRTDHAAVRHIFLRLDNTKCVDRCFREARHAAGFIALALRGGWDPGVQVASVGVAAQIDSNRCQADNLTQYSIDAASPSAEINMYSYSYAGDHLSIRPPLWAIVAAVVGGICIIVLLIVIVIIIIRIRKLNAAEDELEQTEMQHIRGHQSLPRGTNV